MHVSRVTHIVFDYKKADHGEICITSKVSCLLYLQMYLVCIVYIKKQRHIKTFSEINVGQSWLQVILELSRPAKS